MVWGWLGCDAQQEEMDSTDTAAYLRRIGYSGPLEPAPDTLRGLHRAHIETVPFENLDIIAGRAISLDTDRLFEKVVRQRRGGFCYELNSLFAALLAALGFRLDLLSARAVCADGSFGPPFDHLALAVHLDEPYLADVGYGGAFREPLRLRLDVEQRQPEGAYRLIPAGDEWLYQAQAADGSWTDHYLFTRQPRRLPEFEAMCRFHQASPDSPFTRRRICSLPANDGRVTVSGDRLIRTVRGERTERDIRDETDLNAILERCFGITPRR
jgi:N-hydroxyarylamine O-acetyltransferase